MSLLEIIERLCEIARLQVEIIQKQAEEIEQAKITDAVSADLLEMRSRAERELATIFKECN